MIKISKRLQEVANYIKDNCNLVDIGCDHGYLDIYLYQNRKNIHIIASDINEKALNSARNNIKKFKLTNKIETRLGNGLDNIKQNEVDTIVMSGLGSHTIVGILYTNRSKLKNVNQIVIQSNTDLKFLRTKVTKLGYYIQDEKIIKEGKIIYTIINFQKGKRRYTPKELYFGPILLKENNKLFIEKNKEELKKLEILIKIIPKNHYHLRIKTHLKIKLLKQIIKKDY